MASIFLERAESNTLPRPVYDIGNPLRHRKLQVVQLYRQLRPICPREQKQILRLTTPNLHPTDEDLSAGTRTERGLGPHSHPCDEDLSPGTPVRSL